MPSQLPAFRLTVAARMEDYRERMAANIARERRRRGESPLEIAVAIGVDKRTVERWEAGEREPQTKKLRALADHWQVAITDIRPDLEAEERELRDQLGRIEAKLDALLVHAGLDAAEIAIAAEQSLRVIEGAAGTPASGAPSQPGTQPRDAGLPEHQRAQARHAAKRRAAARTSRT
jgi:transcriptional regulator with XRE-family HTH domain